MTVFGITRKAHRFAVDNADGAEGMPRSVAGHGFATADNMNGDDGNIGSSGDHPDSRFGFSEVAIKSSLAFRKENESPFVFKDFEDIF